jgi:hypothetical protein
VEQQHEQTDAQRAERVGAADERDGHHVVRVPGDGLMDGWIDGWMDRWMDG